MIEDVLKGEEVIIAKNGEPIVSLNKLKTKSKRVGGQFKGKIKITNKFDVLPEDFMQYFQ